MPDGSHLCSNEYLNKCLGFFKKVSEDEATKMLKSGFIKPAPQEEESK